MSAAGGNAPALPPLRPILYRAWHNPDAATLLFTIEERQRQLWEFADAVMTDDGIASTMTDDEFAALGFLLGRAHIMRHDALRLLVDELMRAIHDR